MKIIFLVFILSYLQVFADVKISELPLGTAASTTALDSFPYVLKTPAVTKRMTVWDIANIPALTGRYAPQASPTFTGTITTPLSANKAVITSSSSALAASAVTSTELGYLSGVTSSVQTQLTGKEPTFSLLNIAKGGTNSSTSLNNNRVMQSLGGAIVESAAITGSRVLVSDSNGIPTASSVTSTTLGYLDPTSSIQTQLNAKEPTITTLSVAKGGTNSGTALNNNRVMQSSSGGIVEASAITAGRALISDTNGIPTASGITSTTLGYLDATSSVQTQIDAKINKSLVTTKGDLVAASAASTPVRLGSGSDGQVLVADSTQTNGLKWATPNSGSKNYFTYNSFENGAVTGWSLGTATLTSNFPSGAPTFGSGASGNLALTAVSGSLIAGTYSLSYASSTATTAGNFVASDAFTIDAEDQAKVLSFKFSYKVQSGTVNMSGTSANSYGVAIYDVSNSAWIQPAGVFNLVQSSGVGQSTGTFQTTSNGTSYRLVIYNANATSGAATLLLDTMFLGPQVTASGVPFSDPVSYAATGSWTANTTYTGFWHQEGKFLHGDVKLAMSGAPTAASLTVNLPSGLTIDTAAMAFASQNQTYLGKAEGAQGGSSYNFQVAYNNTTSVAVIYQNATTGAQGVVNATAPVTWASGATIHLYFSVPIVGWSSNTVQSSDTATNVISMRAPKTSGSHTSNGAWQDITGWDAVSKDTAGAFNTTTGQYLCTVSGDYLVSGSITFNAVATGVRALRIVRNGTDVFGGSEIAGSTAATVGTVISSLVPCNAGDNIRLQAFQNSGGNLVYNANGYNSLAISRVSGPATITATETVSALYTGAPPTGTLTTAYNTTTFGTKVKDSHNMYSGGSLTIPISGTYSIAATARYSATYVLGSTVAIAVFVDGVQKASNIVVAAAAVGVLQPLVSVHSLPLLAGQVVTIRSYAGGTSPTFTSAADENYFSITRTGNY